MRSALTSPEGKRSFCVHFAGKFGPLFLWPKCSRGTAAILTKEEWELEEFPKAPFLLESQPRWFPQLVTKVSRRFPAECWKRPLVVRHGHCQLWWWTLAFYCVIRPSWFLESEAFAGAAKERTPPPRSSFWWPVPFLDHLGKERAF